jgi:hypothetical protein
MAFLFTMPGDQISGSQASTRESAGPNLDATLTGNLRNGPLLKEVGNQTKIQGSKCGTTEICLQEKKPIKTVSGGEISALRTALQKKSCN